MTKPKPAKPKPIRSILRGKKAIAFAEAFANARKFEPDARPWRGIDNGAGSEFGGLKRSGVGKGVYVAGKTVDERLFSPHGHTVKIHDGTADDEEHVPPRGRPSRVWPGTKKAEREEVDFRSGGTVDAPVAASGRFGSRATSQLAGRRSGQARGARSFAPLIVDVAERLHALDRESGPPPDGCSFAGRVVDELKRTYRVTVTADYVRQVLKRAGTATPAAT